MIRMDDEVFEVEDETQLLWKGIRLQLHSLLENMKVQMDHYDDDEIFDFILIRGFLLYSDLILRRQDAEIENRLGHPESE